MNSDQLLRAFLSGRPLETKAAYERDLRHYRDFMGLSETCTAISQLLTSTQAEANATALTYRAHLRESVSAATVNRRISALRSLVQMARSWGLTGITLEVKGLASSPLRDSRGPTQASIRKIFAVAKRRKGRAAVRNRAILYLLYGLALRKGETVNLDLEHVDLSRGVVMVLGKGRTQREPLSLPSAIQAALSAWIKVRGTTPGPLFDIGPRTINQMVGSIAREAGIVGVVRPHGLRHAAITEALEATNGDVRRVQKFSRHRSLDMLLIYDDARRDLGGEVAELVSKRLRGKR